MGSHLECLKYLQVNVSKNICRRASLQAALAYLQFKTLNPIDLDRLEFVGASLKLLREEVASDAAVLGFIGAPWTLATYIVEGGSSSYYKVIKSMMFSNPQLLDTLLAFLADQIATYAIYQVTNRIIAQFPM